MSKQDISAFSPSDFRLLLEREFGLEDNQVLDRVSLYLYLVRETNKSFNLTAITDPVEMVQLHYLDSCSILPWLDKLGQEFSGTKSLIDVGTGAGFPGIPVKINRLEWQVTLLDSLLKRVNFLRETAKTLDLELACIHDRAELAGHRPELREQFYIATARAVADLASLAEYCLPFVKIGGYFLAMKASGLSEEVERAKPAISRLGGELMGVEDLSLPGLDLVRKLVIIKKIKSCPGKFPRKPGTPRRSPLR